MHSYKIFLVSVPQQNEVICRRAYLATYIL